MSWAQAIIPALGVGGLLMLIAGYLIKKKESRQERRIKLIKQARELVVELHQVTSAADYKSVLNDVRWEAIRGYVPMVKRDVIEKKLGMTLEQARAANPNDLMDNSVQVSVDLRLKELRDSIDWLEKRWKLIE